MGWEATSAGNQCKDWNVRTLFLPTAPKQEIENLQACLVNLVGIKDLNRSPIDMCLDRDLRSKIAGTSFLGCHQNLKILGYSMGDIFNKCTLSHASMVSHSAFPTCHQTQVKYNVTQPAAFEKCLNNRFLERQTDRKYQECLGVVKDQAGPNSGQLPLITCESEAMSNLVNDSDLKSCLNSNRFGSKTEATMLCFIPMF